MVKALIFSLKIIVYGMLLPFRIWQNSKDKLLGKAGSKSIKNLLDDDYVVTSWIDLLIDAIIFLLYPIGLFIVLIGVLTGSFFTRLSFIGLLVLIPIYFFPFILSIVRELGGSLMLLHLNVKRILKNLEEK